MRCKGGRRVAILAAAGGLAVAAPIAPGAEPAPAPAVALQRAALTPVHGGVRLRLVAAAAWSTDELLTSGTQLCTILWAGDRAPARARLCVAAAGAGLVLRSDRLGSDGHVASSRVLSDPVQRPDQRTATARLRRGDLGVAQPVLFWEATAGAADCGPDCPSRRPQAGRRTLDLRPPRTTLPGLLAPPDHPDARDAVGSPLDIRDVSFGQRDLRLELTIRMARAWSAAAIGPGRSVCVVLSQPGGGSRGRLCVGRSTHDRPVLRYTQLHSSGAPGPAASIPAAVSRSDPRSLRARFPARAVGLRYGRVRWAVQSLWSDAGLCRLACADRAPDAGTFTARVSVLARPRCFAAASRAAHGCRNPLFRRAVYPLPRDAPVWPNAPCRPYAEPLRTAVFDPCEFGVGASHASEQVALIGDSHAVHWRAALEVVAQARRWRAISITRPGCPFSTQVPRSPALGPGACVQLHDRTLAWLGAHAEIHTVFISDWAEPPWGPQGGTGAYGGGPAAFGAMFDRLPSTVRHIVVLRDVPATTLRAITCVDRLRRRRAPLRNACSADRLTVLRQDPGAAAAAARAPRGRVVDLTRFFCGPARCYPVVGGAYVYKDDNHMNAVFSQSLGPYLLRRLGSAGG